MLFGAIFISSVCTVLVCLYMTAGHDQRWVSAFGCNHAFIGLDCSCMVYYKRNVHIAFQRVYLIFVCTFFH